MDKYEKEIPCPRQTRIGLLCKQHAGRRSSEALIADECDKAWPAGE